MDSKQKQALASVQAAEQKLPWHPCVPDYILPRYSETQYSTEQTFQSFEKYLKQATAYRQKLAEAAQLRQAYFGAYEAASMSEKLAMRVWRQSLNTFAEDARLYLEEASKLTAETFSQYEEKPSKLLLVNEGQIYSYLPPNISDAEFLPLSAKERARRKKRRAAWRKRKARIEKSRPRELGFGKSGDNWAASVSLDPARGDISVYRSAAVFFTAEARLANTDDASAIVESFLESENRRDIHRVLYFALCRDESIAKLAWNTLSKREKPYVDMDVTPLWLWHRDLLKLRAPVSEQVLYYAGAADILQMAVSYLVIGNINWSCGLQHFLEMKVAEMREAILSDFRALENNKAVHKLYKKGLSNILARRFDRIQPILNLWARGIQVRAIAANLQQSAFVEVLKHRRDPRWSRNVERERSNNLSDKVKEEYREIATKVLAQVSHHLQEVVMILYGEESFLYEVPASTPSRRLAVIRAADLDPDIMSAREVFNSPLAAIFAIEELSSAEQT